MLLLRATPLPKADFLPHHFLSITSLNQGKVGHIMSMFAQLPAMAPHFPHIKKAQLLTMAFKILQEPFPVRLTL